MNKKQGRKEVGKEKHFYDGNYKYIFQHKELIKALIKFILPDKLIRQVNWETLKSEKTDFVPKDLRSKLADVIFGMKLKNNESLYVFFLIEFQTSVDKQMALRLFIYIALFYHHLIKTGRIRKNDEEIPVVLPIVLYTGDRRWAAGEKLSQLMNKEIFGIVKEYLPELRYILVDKNRYSLEELKRMKNAATGLLYLEKIKEPEIQKHLGEFVKVFSRGIGREQFNMLVEYFAAMVSHKFGRKINIKNLTKEEVPGMSLLTAIDKWQEKNKLEGKIEDAKKMLDEGCEFSFISRITGLRKTQILKLKSFRRRKV